MLVVGSLILSLGGPVEAAEDDPMTDEQVVIKNEGSHQLLLPKDWPVKHQDGLIKLGSTEEYLSLKFAQVRERFSLMDERLEALEHRVQQVEEERRLLQVQLRLLQEHAQRQEASHGDSTEDSQATGSETTGSPEAEGHTPPVDGR